MPGPPINLAERILLARLRLGLGQAAFGQRFGVEKNAVVGWERGVTPKGERLAQLRQIFTDVLPDLEEEQAEIHAHQLFLPFDQPVNFEFRVSRRDPDSVRFAVEIKRRTG
jgi:transcriptional regulator with XRE-family HTH domain